MKWTAEQIAEVLRMRDSGMTLRKIGEVHGLSAERIRNIEAKAYQDLRSAQRGDPFDLLSVRARNALRSKGLNTVEAVRNASEAGALMKIDNFGKTSYAEVLRWLVSQTP